MKLATYKDGSRDGQLVVVSRDLSTAHYATGIAHTLQQVLDDWNFIAPQLQDLYVTLNQGKARHAFPFSPRQCMAPLPRPHQWLTPVAATAAGCWLGQGPSGDARGPTDDLVLADEAWALTGVPQLAAVTGDVPEGAAPGVALEGVRLLVLALDLTLQRWAAAEQTAGMAGVRSRPGVTLGPVAVTPDELGDAWRQGQAQLALQWRAAGATVQRLDAGQASHHWGQLLAQLCATRRLRAGALVGCGALGAGPDAPVSHGDTLHLDALGRDGLSLFGAIEQAVVPRD